VIGQFGHRIRIWHNKIYGIWPVTLWREKSSYFVELCYWYSIVHKARNKWLYNLRDQYVESFFSRQFVQHRKRDSVEKRSNSYEGFRREAIVKSILQHFPSPSSLPISLPSTLHYITHIGYTINSTARNFNT